MSSYGSPWGQENGARGWVVMDTKKRSECGGTHGWVVPTGGALRAWPLSEARSSGVLRAAGRVGKGDLHRCTSSNAAAIGVHAVAHYAPPGPATASVGTSSAWRQASRYGAQGS